MSVRAGDGTRTHDLHVGNVSLYQLSYTRDSRLNIGDLVSAVKASSKGAAWPAVRPLPQGTGRGVLKFGEEGQPINNLLSFAGASGWPVPVDGLQLPGRRLPARRAGRATAAAGFSA